MIWILKNRPNKDPKFHQYEILIGVGSLNNVDLKIFKIWFIKIINLIFVELMF